MIGIRTDSLAPPHQAADRRRGVRRRARWIAPVVAATLLAACTPGDDSNERQSIDTTTIPVDAMKPRSTDEKARDAYDKALEVERQRYKDGQPFKFLANTCAVWETEGGLTVVTNPIVERYENSDGRLIYLGFTDPDKDGPDEPENRLLNGPFAFTVRNRDGHLTDDGIHNMSNLTLVGLTAEATAALPQTNPQLFTDLDGSQTATVAVLGTDTDGLKSFYAGDGSAIARTRIFTDKDVVQAFRNKTLDVQALCLEVAGIDRED